MDNGSNKKNIRTKSNYFKPFKQGITSKEANDYYKTLLNKTIRAAERKYYTDFFCTHSKNFKKTWDGIRSMMGNIKASNYIPTCFKINDTFIEDKKK